MKVLVVHAHPEEKSFCSSLKNTDLEYFELPQEIKIFPFIINLQIQ
jgi:hypothetical protein